MGTSLRKMYDAELMALDTMLARMGHAAGGAIESAMTALRTGDAEMARSVIARDSEIDAAEHEIEHRCLTLFLRQQPVAGDLRKVSTALKWSPTLSALPTRPATLPRSPCISTPRALPPWA